MMIDDAIRDAKSDRQICELLMAYMESLDPDRVECDEAPTECGIDGVRARFRGLIHKLDKVSTCGSDKRPVINQALYIYSEALSRLQMLSAAAAPQADPESAQYPRLMPTRESALIAA